MALEEHPRLSEEQWEHVEVVIDQVNGWSGWSKASCLSLLGVSRTAYYRWRRCAVGWGAEGLSRAGPRPPHAVLAQEREAVVAYALAHASVRHRELAWKMVDEDVAYLSPSTVYRILRDEGLVSRWLPKRAKRHREDWEKASGPDERWQSDIRYIGVQRRKYYLVLFLDEYSRYVVHHELMCYLDGDTLSLEAQRALEKLGGRARPVIQTDNGSGYISGEFKRVLDEHDVGHVRIRPHCPEENGLVERAHRSLGEALDEVELRDLEHARMVVDEIVRWYNEERLHSALHFLRPIDYYRGDPERLLEERRGKLAEARQRRRETNLGIRQRMLWLEDPKTEVKHSLISGPICATC